MITVFNTVFTLLMPFAFSIAEEDIVPDLLEEHPELYRPLPFDVEFNGYTMFAWMASAVWHACVIFFGLRLLFPDESMDSNGRAPGLRVWGGALTILLIVIVNSKMALEFRTWNKFSRNSLIITVVVGVALMVAFDRNADNIEMASVLYNLVVTPRFWLAALLIVFAALLPDVVLKALRRHVWPTPTMIVQEQHHFGKEGMATPARIKTFWPLQIYQDGGNKGAKPPPMEMAESSSAARLPRKV